MRRKIIFIGVIVIIGAVGFITLRGKPPETQTSSVKVGILQYAPVSKLLTQGFVQGMEDMGYSEGINIEYIVKEITLDNDILENNAQDLISQDVDLIYAITTVAGFAARDATISAGRSDIPIVWTHAAGAVGRELAESYESSGNNTTGIEISFEELTRKKMEFLQRIDPTIKKVGMLNPLSGRDIATEFTQPTVVATAPQYDMTIVEYPIESAGPPQSNEEIKKALDSIKAGDIDAYIYTPGPSTSASVDDQVAMTKRLKIPSFWLTQEEVLRGGLFTYEHDNIAMGKQSAVQADKVIGGVAPADIPIEFPKKISFIMNFDTIDETGLVIPEEIRSLVDIEVRE